MNKRSPLHLKSEIQQTDSQDSMGQGQELKTRAEPQVEIQERGEIFFFYRPKVNKEEAHSADDVQRLYIVLRPESDERPVEEKQAPVSGKEGTKKVSNASSSKNGSKGGHGSQEVNIEKQPLLRLMVLGRKSLPDLSKKSLPYWGFVELVTTNIEDVKNALKEVNIEKQPLLRLMVLGRKSLPDLSKKSLPYWGFVELVTANIEDVKNALKEEEYDTSTRGHRRKPPARPLGEGIYGILRHKQGKRMHTHLVYKLEFPPEDANNEAQESLNVKREGSYKIQIKNPEQHGSTSSQFRGLQNKRKAKFPAHLQEKFGHLRYCPADPPDILNYEGCEFLLISASDHIEEELGLELKQKKEKQSHPVLIC